MPTNDPIAAARREAKSRARKGSVTHQQALDAVAIENGHRNWAEMKTAIARARSAEDDRVRAFVNLVRPHGGIAPDDELKALLEDAIHGYLEEPDGSDITEYVDNYEFRGDGFDLTPNAFQRDIMQTVIEGFMDEERARRGLRGPYLETPFLVDEWPIFKGPEQSKPASLRKVEHDMKHIMDRAREHPSEGMSISRWISSRMSEAAQRSLHKAGPADRPLAQLPMTTDNIAYAMDPAGGPYDLQHEIVVRCPLHGKDGPERNPSLVIAGMSMRCMAGCDEQALESHLVERLCEAGNKARDFMKRNDASPVTQGSSNAERGGMGGTYGLADRSFHKMDTLTCRLLPEGYPRWEFGGTD